MEKYKSKASRLRQSPHSRNVLYIVLFMALVLGIWIGTSFWGQTQSVDLPAAHGYYDLSEYSFDNTVYRTGDHWESWPEALYTPADFAGGVTDEPVFLSQTDYKSIPYATHRLRISLPANQTYGMSMLTSEYAMRLFIDGVEIESIGSPGTTRETTEHRAVERTYYFTTASGEVEIIVHAANFVHAKGGAWPPRFYIGEAQSITRWDSASLAVNYMVIGCLVTTFLYHLGLFCLNRSRKIVLLFSLCCLLLTLLNKKMILMCWPEYNWQVGIRIEYLLHFATLAMLVFFLNTLHPGLLHKWIARGYYALAGIYALTLFLDSTIFTGLLLYFEIVSVGMIGYVLVSMALRVRSGRMADWISFIGILVLGLLGASDILYYRGITIIPPIAGQFFMVPIGMVFFVFCYALVLSLAYAQTERAMEDARANEQHLAAENAALDRVDRLKTELIATISHEARTPLAVLSSYAGLVAMELKDKGTDAQITADLDTIVFEAKRVANLIDGMKKLTLHSEETARRVRLDLSEIVRQTAGLYQHIFDRKKVSLMLRLEEQLPPIFGSPEELTQVLLNLLHNAKLHTEQGTVTITVNSGDGGITTIVADTGAGIAPELLSHVFERGVSGHSEGSGLGLAICQEVIESHGGTIAITSALDEGTAVTFTLPIYREGMEDAK